MQDVLKALITPAKPLAMAVIIRQIGSSYRPLGAAMLIMSDGKHVGHISSGCIEADLIMHIQNLETPRVLRFGAGSPYFDLKLPCGGAMDVLLVPLSDCAVLEAAAKTLAARQPVSLRINTTSGEMSKSDQSTTKLINDDFHWHIEPELNFMVFGNGFEGIQFAELAHGAGYPVTFHSTQAEVLGQVKLKPENVVLLAKNHIPDASKIDAWTSIALFFHEHDLEDQILSDAVKTPAFYIGAQGSVTAHSHRVARMHARGASEQEIARCRGPIGLIQKVHDPRTLAVSVLAEILTVSRERSC